jgi:hypothetical protein
MVRTGWMARIPLVVALVALTVGLLPAGAPLLNAAGSGWLPPLNLSNWQNYVHNDEYNRVEVGADGTVLVCWRTYDPGSSTETLWARVRSPAGVWSAAFNPSGALPQNTLSGNTVACRVAPDGTAWVLWRWRDGNPGTEHGVRGAYRTPGGDWQPLNLTFGSTVAEIRSLDLAIGPDGHRAAVWVGCNTSVAGTTCFTDGRRGPAGSVQWTNVFRADSEVIMSRQAGVATVVVGSGGLTVVVWERYYNAGNRELVARAWLPAANDWDASVTQLDNQLNPPITDWLARPVMAPDGTVVVAYNTRLPLMAQKAMHFSVWRSPAGVWSAPMAISNDYAAGDLKAPRLAVGPNGTVIAAWERATSGTTSVLEANTRAPGGAWGSSATLTGAQVFVRGFDLGVGPDGSGWVVWSAEDKSVATLRSNTYFSRRPPGGAWGSGGQGALDGWYTEAHGVALAVASDGGAVALWAGSDSSQPVNQQDRVRAAVFPRAASGWGAAETLAAGMQIGAVWRGGLAVRPGGRPFVGLWYYLRDVTTGGRTAIFFGELPWQRAYLPAIRR